MPPLSQKKIIVTTATLLLAILVSFAAFAENSSSTPTAETTVSSSTASRDELAAKIEERTKQLDEINKELDETKKNLQGTQTQKQTLQGQLNTLSNTASQLNLNIKADEVRIQKLALQIESLGYDIGDIKASLSNKKLAIARLFVELEKTDRENVGVLTTFLKSSSLADGFLEVQNITSLQNKLGDDIENLIKLHDTYVNKISEADDKKQELVYNRENLQQRKFIVEDQKSDKQVLLSKTKNQETLFQKQLKELQELQRQIANEVEALGAILRTKIDPATLPPLKPGVLAMPIKTNKSDVTQDYGSTDFAKYGYKGKWHNGIDIRALVGTPVLASEDGVVVATGDQDKYCYKGAYGKFIVINHKNNLTTLYGHLSRITVEKGKEIKRGDVIGYSGQSGYATGPHLHFTVFAQPTFYMGPSKVCGPMPFGGDLNPLGYL